MIDEGKKVLDAYLDLLTTWILLIQLFLLNMPFCLVLKNPEFEIRNHQLQVDKRANQQSKYLKNPKVSWTVSIQEMHAKVFGMKGQSCLFLIEKYPVCFSQRKYFEC